MLMMSFFVPAKSGLYEPTLGNYAAAPGDPFQWEVLARTLKLGFLTTVITLVLGYPLAWNLARASGQRKARSLVLLISPLLVGVVIRSFGWMVLLADNGLVNSLLRASGLAPAKPTSSSRWGWWWSRNGWWDWSRSPGADGNEQATEDRRADHRPGPEGLQRTPALSLRHPFDVNLPGALGRR